MKKFINIAAICLFGLTGLSAYAQNQNLDPEITQTGKYQWKLTWTEFHSANASTNRIYFNGEPTVYSPYLVAKDDATNTKIYLTCIAPEAPGWNTCEVQFPYYGNFMTVDLGGRNLADGEYILTLPAGLVNLNPGHLYNDDVIELLVVGEDVNPEFPLTIWGPEGTNNMRFSWGDNVTKLRAGNTEGAYMTNVDTQKKYDLLFLQGENYSKANLRIDNVTLVLNLTNNYPDLPDGTYDLVIPANYVLFNGTSVGNGAINNQFEYGAPWSQGKVEYNGPNDGDLITVSWINASKLELNPNYRGDGFGTTGIMLWDWDGDDPAVQIPVQNIQISGNTANLNLEGMDLKKGAYRMNIPPGYFNVTTEKGVGENEDEYYPFTYKNGEDDPNQGGNTNYPYYSKDAVWSIANADVVNSDNNPIEVSWEGATVSLMPNPSDNVNWYSVEKGYGELTFGEEVTISNDGTKLLIDCSSLEPSTYRINIPECLYLEADGQMYINQGTSIDDVEIDVDQTPGTPDIPGNPDDTGIESITADNGIYRVYNTNGVKVLETENKEVLLNLQNGLYIVNGKKIVK